MPKTTRNRENSLPDSAIVIGAGIAGLATAGLLACRGVEVTIIDKLGSIGGRAGELNVDGFRWDTGPSWYLMPEAFDHFFELMGTRAEDVYELKKLDPAYRIYGPSGHRADVRTGVNNVAELFESLEPGAGQRVRDYLAQATDAYRMALKHFLYTTFTAPLALLHRDIRVRLGRLAELLLTDLQSYVSRRFEHPLLRQILSYPAVFLSTEPARTPALYSLLNHTDLVDGVRYPQGGFAAVMRGIAQLVRDTGVHFELDCEAQEILTVPTGKRGKAQATGVRVRQDGASRVLRADAVISAADLHHTETQLVPAHLQTYPERYWQRREPGLGTVLLLLGVEGELSELAHHTFLFSDDWDPDFRAVFHGSGEPGRSQSIYVSRTSATDPTSAPEGSENLFVLVPVSPELKVGHGDAYHDAASARVDEIAQATIRQIAGWTGISDLPDRVTVQRTLGPEDFAERYHAWAGGSIGPAHTLRQSAFLRGKNVSSHITGLYYAGATTVPGVGVPMCLISAENVLKRMLDDASPAPLQPTF